MLPTRRADLVTRTVDGEVVILDRATGNVHRLNATASFIWNHCDGTSTSAEIAARVATNFERTPEQVLADVTEALANLERLGLLAQPKA
jgi:PqqD family protein of HPr-rel-A system